MIAVGALLHVKQLSRSPFEIATALIVPVVQATLAVYLFRAGGEPGRLLEAAVGAGLMGVWSSVLFGSGGAIQSQRWQGTLEMIMLAPRPPALVILPITLGHRAHRHVRDARHPGLGPVALRHPARLRPPGRLPGRGRRLHRSAWACSACCWPPPSCCCGTPTP